MFPVRTDDEMILRIFAGLVFIFTDVVKEAVGVRHEEEMIYHHNNYNYKTENLVFHRQHTQMHAGYLSFINRK